MLIDILLLIVGLVVLLLGAESMVRGASSLAYRLRVSPLLIGLTVVSIGTSAPELTVNILAAFGEAPDLAVGNVIGSNISNILLILGITALIVPLTVKSSTVWKEIPLALLGVVLVFIMGNDQMFDGVGFDAITRTDGIALLSLMIIFMYYVYDLAKHDRKTAKQLSEPEGDVTSYSTWTAVVMTLLGVGALVVGGRFLVDGAVGLAETAGLSEAFIGLTIVAIGTSLPELATSVVAALRGKADLAVGNVIGSNIFNVFFVLGITSVITPLEQSRAIDFDIIVSIIATILLFTYMFIGGKRRVSRWQGGVFVALYVAYMLYLIIRG